MKSEADQLKTFLGDVASHELTIVRDHGVNRHLRFKRPGSGQYRFDLITWPGHLCYTGDMGTFVFSRVTDMFDFFRRTGDRLFQIDFRYWAEKALAVDKSGISRWDEDRFRADVRDYFDTFVEDNDRWPKNRADALWAAIEEDVLSVSYDGEWRAQMALYDFDYGPESFRFTDWERTSHEWTYGFVWCCYALTWAIAVYDRERAAKLAELDRCQHEGARVEDQFCCTCGKGLVWTGATAPTEASV